jgi:hypothetical protein
MGKQKEFEVHFEVKYVPLPPEKEEAYWAAMRYFSEMLQENIQKENEMLSDGTQEVRGFNNVTS